MYLDECPAWVLGLDGRRDLHVWCCAHQGCGRYFYGTVGYRYKPPTVNTDGRTVQCSREGAYLVAQRALGRYICPVSGCHESEPWPASDHRLAAFNKRTEARSLPSHLARRVG